HPSPPLTGAGVANRCSTARAICTNSSLSQNSRNCSSPANATSSASLGTLLLSGAGIFALPPTAPPFHLCVVGVVGGAALGGGVAALSVAPLVVGFALARTHGRWVPGWGWGKR